MTAARTPQHNKQFIVLRRHDGRHIVVQDYGDYAWNSVIYEAVKCCDTYREARTFARHANAPTRKIVLQFPGDADLELKT